MAKSAAKTAKPRSTTLPPALTHLHIHASGVTLDDEERARVRERMGKKLGRFGPSIERATVRFSEAGDGLHETLCRVKVFFSDMPSIVVDETSESMEEALDRAASGAARTVRRVLEHPPKEMKRAAAPAKRARREALPRGAEQSPLGSEGELIGKRVGRSAERVALAAARPEKKRRDVPVDTAEPGVSATDRKAGGGSTARRNAKLNRAGLTSDLEDSATGRPSRKSTRRSADRTKRDANLEQRAKRATTSAKSRARRAAADRPKGRGRKES